MFNKAKLIIECLMASDGVDLKFEEGFCLFLLGQVNEAEAVERLKLLDMNSNSSLQKSKDFKRNKLSMELWLKESVLNVFPDTRHCSPSLVNFFNSDKKAYETKKNKGSFQKFPAKIHRPLATALASERRESLPNVNSFQHLGSAAKQLTFLQSQEISGKGSGIALVKMERKLGSHSSSTFWGTLLAIKEIVGRAWLEGFLHLVAKKDMVVGRIIFVTVLGCIIFTLSGRSRTTWTYGIHRPDGKSLVLPSDSYKNGRGRINRSCIAGAMKKLLAKVRVKFADAKKTLKPSLYASRISMKDQSMQMPVEEAESLVKQWQAIKAEALGPGHQVHSLSDILDGSMLAQWHALADSARTKSCYWRFVLLQMSILRAEILSDARGSEIAEVDALLEEAAELVDGSLPKKPNYHSFYKTRYLLERQYDGSWKFCKVDVENPFEMLNQVR